MKNLSDYTGSIDEIVRKAGAFYAFNNEQLEENVQDGIKYVSLGSGLICPKENAKQLVSDISENVDRAVKQDVAENGIEAIIRRELYNHEALYTYDIQSTVDALEIYDITFEQIQEVFINECRKQDE